MKKQTRRSSAATSWGDATRAIHSGENKHGVGAPVSTPIARTSNFTFASTAEMKRWAEGRSRAYIYTRYGNPTLEVAEARLAELERAEASIVTASGMAAISSVLLAAVRAGEEIIASQQLYGGTYRLMRDILPRLGISVRHVGTDLAGVEKFVNEKTRLLYVESPTNPTLRLVDLPKAVAFARRHTLFSVIDNTFATPVLQKPLELGFDAVVHSATKFLGGHSDLIAGVVAGRRSFIREVREMVIYLGGSLDPEPGYLLIRGLKTLSVRVRQQSQTALAVAKFLARHPRVERVHYPGLPSHPDHRLARRAFCDGLYGSMLAFDIQGGIAAARRFCDRTRVFLLAASLGGVESLVVLPVYTSHYRMSRRELEAAGVGPGTVRVSIGLEDPADLIADLKQALR